MPENSGEDAMNPFSILAVAFVIVAAVTALLRLPFAIGQYKGCFKEELLETFSFWIAEAFAIIVYFVCVSIANGK